MTESALAARVDGFAIVDKPTGTSSYKALASISRRLGKGIKAGHAGTLDPFASGVLVCLFGRYTRLSDFFMGADKGYEATMRFGIETDTLDPEGVPIANAPVPSLRELENALAAFRGPISQTPPAFSAIHVDGKRSYELARSGLSPDLEPRSVNIARLELLSYEGADARVLVHCSKGTYMRSLARDIALACGSRAHLTALRRTFSGPFSLRDAVRPDELDLSSLKRLSAAQAGGLGMDTIVLSGDDESAFRHGLPLYRLDMFKGRSSDRPVCAFNDAEEAIGIARMDGSAWRYAMVFEDMPWTS